MSKIVQTTITFLTFYRIDDYILDNEYVSILIYTHHNKLIDGVS